MPSSSTSAYLSSIRGGLSPDSLGARGIERFGRNPGCRRLAVLTAAQVLPKTILTQVYGRSSDKEPAPFAIILGNRFEQHLFEHNAARLVGLYQREQRLGPSERHVVDLKEMVPGTKPEHLAERVERTRDLLRDKLRKRPDAPNLILKPRLEMEVMGSRFTVEPDFLVAATHEAFYRIGEIKIYADREGKTDPSDLRSGCRQAAVGLAALRHTAQGLGYGHDLPAVGDLILRKSGSLHPTLRPMTIEGEVATLDQALEELPGLVQEAQARLRGTLDDPAVLDALPNNFVEGCMEFCALSPICKEQAVSCRDPIILGTTARETLSQIQSIARALELLGSQGEPPRTPEERMLQVRLRKVNMLYEEALSYV